MVREVGNADGNADPSKDDAGLPGLLVLWRLTGIARVWLPAESVHTSGVCDGDGRRQAKNSDA